MDHQKFQRTQPPRPSTPVQPVPKNKTLKKRLFMLVLAVLAVGLLFSTYYFWQKYRRLVQNPDIVRQDEIKTITAKISKYMDLPADETPDMAKVTDTAKLQGQPFFQKSQNGDEVLIYLKARKAILYRPSVNRVIDVVPLSQNVSPAPENTAPETSAGQK